ncbi:hypothetical protein [uncultured Tenacibaculum sp.]|uniref:hypothetical protein n=1 Tax=uncultured Tenacibaculum sp. TaxID=174713 RepID=UPI00260448DD|nr:hypothetical protein [uncultured Tenacibaculum sp.]
MASITIGANPVLTDLNTTVNYNPNSNYPAVTVFNNGNNNYSVYALCYIPTGTLVPKSVTDFCQGNYSGYTPTQAVSLVGTSESATVVLANFEDIQTADLVQSTSTQFTSRSFAVCYDFDAQGASSYECKLYALEFNYTIDDNSSFEVLFLAQGDLDPELSRGTVTTPAVPPPPTM